MHFSILEITIFVLIPILGYQLGVHYGKKKQKNEIAKAKFYEVY